MTDTESDAAAGAMIRNDPSVELSSNRTSLSFERTRMSADRTLMSIVRTSLSLISFGFTIYQVFNKIGGQGMLVDADRTARSLGVSLLVLGVLLLVMGIWAHARFGAELNLRRERLFGMHLLHSDIHYRATPTFFIAGALLFVGLAALGSIAFRLFG